jgi:ParB family chromosome partitioning protein
MKAAEQLQARLGSNMQASLGAHRQGRAGGVAALPPGLTGDAGQYRGCVRIKDALAIELERIVPDPEQPRKEFDQEAIDRLARSLTTRGQLIPIRVRWADTMGKYAIVAGERRYRAAIQAGLATLQCIVASGPLTQQEVLQEQLIENCLREDLKPIEQANALRKLMDENGWSAQQVAEELNLSKPAVIKALSLLKLPGSVQEQVEAGHLAPSVAYEISQLDRPQDQAILAEQVTAERLTREEVVSAVKARQAGRTATTRAAKQEVRLNDGTKVSVAGPAAGAGPEAVIQALRQAIKQLQAASRLR